MSDKQNKASDHLPDPLDYLYEELSPKGMAETRLHLGECPSCREEMIKTREAVKQYRQTSRPVPPSGLAARTAAKALAEARRARLPAGTGYTGPLEHPPVPVRPAGGLDEQEFIRLKEEILGEIRENRRSWLFHPAWTVAASVVFICAVLIHVSPRSNLWLSGDAYLPTESAAPVRPHLREQGAPISAPEEPPAPLRESKAHPAAPLAPSPALSEAEALEKAAADTDFAPLQSPPPEPPVMDVAAESAVDGAAPDYMQPAAVPPPTTFGAAPKPPVGVVLEQAEPQSRPAPAKPQPPRKSAAAGDTGAVSGSVCDFSAPKRSSSLSSVPTPELKEQAPEPAAALPPQSEDMPSPLPELSDIEADDGALSPTPQPAMTRESAASQGFSLPQGASLPGAMFNSELHMQERASRQEESIDAYVVTSELVPEQGTLPESMEQDMLRDAAAAKLRAAPEQTGRLLKKRDISSVKAEAAAGSLRPPMETKDDADAEMTVVEPEALPEIGDEIFFESGGEEKAEVPVVDFGNFWGDMSEPPQLIPRPTLIDVNKLALDLAVMAGMNIGHGEFEEARLAIGLLRKYDPAKADELTALLERVEAEKMLEVEAAAKQAESETQGEGDNDGDEDEPSSGFIPDKYYSPETPSFQSPTPADVEDGSVSRPADSAGEDVSSPDEAGNQGESSNADEAQSPGEPTAATEAAVNSKPVLLDLPEETPSVSGVPGYFIGPVYSEGETPPSFSDPEPGSAAAEPTVSALPPVQSASPPTLWETGQGGRGRSASERREVAPRQRMFSTDPYIRGE